MKKDSISFEVNMTVKELYRFVVYHAYHKMTGIIEIVLAIAAIIFLLVSFDIISEQTRSILILIIVWVVILDPFMLYSRSKSQVKRNKAYQKPLQYQINEQGVSISQNEQSQTVEWKQFLKIVETKHQFLVYSNPVYAFIFPKSEMGENVELFTEMVKEYTRDTGVRLLGKLKGK